MPEYNCPNCKMVESSSAQPSPCGCIPAKKCCSGTIMIPLTAEEVKTKRDRIYKEQVQEVKDARDASLLPKWCLATIAKTAWDQGHAYGQFEVDGIEVDLIHEFETAMAAEAKKSKPLPTFDELSDESIRQWQTQYSRRKL